MKEKKIILKIYNDLPTPLVSQLMTTLPKSGVNIYKANGSKEF